MNTYFSRTLRFFIGFASIGISIAFLRAGAYYFNAFFLALIIVLTVSPLMLWMRRHRFPAALALLIGLIITLSFTALLAGVIALSVLRIGQMLPLFATQIEGAITAVDQFLLQYGISLSELAALIEPQEIVSFGTRMLNGVLESVSLFFMTLLIIVFMSVEAFAFPDKVERQLRLGNPQFMTVYSFADNIRQYVSITTILGLVGGIFVGVVLYLFGLDFAGMWAILYFVMNYVPMLGFWFALIPPVLLAFATLGVGPAVVIFLFYMIISTLINQVLKPAFMRGGLDLSPLWSVLSLVFWAAILGPPGFIIGVPLTIALKELVLATDEDNAWINDVISATVPKDELPLAAAGVTPPQPADQAETGS